MVDALMCLGSFLAHKMAVLFKSHGVILCDFGWKNSGANENDSHISLPNFYPHIHLT